MITNESEDSSVQTFRFSFPNPEVDEVASVSLELDDSLDKSKDVTESRNNASIMKISNVPNEDYLREVEKEASVINIESNVVKYIPSSSIFKITRRLKSVNKFADLEVKESDLIPGVYEGGFKVWECAIDLASYLYKNSCFKNNSCVLELGCGAGIPGLMAYLSGCDVTFQDFNSEVLELSTIPNVYINTPHDQKSQIFQRCTFICGNWQDITSKLYEKAGTVGKKYDMIITSETIYEKANHCHLLKLMKSSLNSSGVVYVAAKSYYFGVGGTLNDFEALVEEDGILQCQCVCIIQEGVQRKIIELKFREVNKNSRK